MAGVSKVTVTDWVKTADEQGFDALRSERRSDRPPKLSTERCAAIDSAIQSDPKSFGFKVWDGPSLSSYINSAFGVRISVRQCQRLFHDLGFPISVHSNTQARDMRIPGNGKRLKKRDEIENDNSLILVYQDEVHFQIQTSVTTAWHKKGSAPIVKSFPGRFKTSYSGFIIPETGELFVSRPENFIFTFYNGKKIPYK